MPFPQSFSVAPQSVTYGIELYEPWDTDMSFSMGNSTYTVADLPTLDYLEPVYVAFVDNWRNALLANKPTGWKARTFRRLFCGEILLDQQVSAPYTPQQE
ncbi:hypothetical protein ACIOHE_15580 [Streptomyces sp. NPDC087851]|uniref:hypothetical protein n=1 Tax=Streptomyces sp. NPDC087851 TaxID=3365810 RepID=UPI0037F729B3